MKIGGFKFGKKERDVPQEQPLEEETAEPIADIIAGVEPVRPHAPLQELALDAETATTEDSQEQPLELLAAAEEEGGTIKLAEVQINPEASAPPPAPAQPPPPPPAPIGKEAPKKNDLMDLGASIGNIFNNLEEEVNPLANLIRALPDVAASELIDDLKEINDIIKDWQKK